MIVVKLGGSLHTSPELNKWLNTLSSYAEQHPVVIVPGGGPFTEQVRRSQQLHQFDDHYAHHMALLAMAQFGLVIAGILPECQILQFPSEKAVPPEKLSIWWPDQQLLSEPQIPHNWDFTSDSCALWLAHKLNADRIILVKNILTVTSQSIEELRDQGIIDAGFQQLFIQSSVSSQIMLAHESEQFSTLVTNSSHLRQLSL